MFFGREPLSSGNKKSNYSFMKQILACLPLILLCSIFSCTKTNNVTTTQYDTTTQVFKDTTVIKDTVWERTPRNPIVGLWVGTWKTSASSTDSAYYSFAIDSNGMMTTTSIATAGNADAAVGPWQLNGTTFTATVTQLSGGTTMYVQNCTAIYDSVAGTLTGTSTFIEGSGSNQTFLLFRIP